MLTPGSYPNYDIRYDPDDSTPVYIGICYTSINGDTAKPIWNIARFTYSGTNVIRIQVLDNQIWNNRASLGWQLVSYKFNPFTGNLDLTGISQADADIRYIKRLTVGGTENINYAGTSYVGTWRWQVTNTAPVRYFEILANGNNFVGTNYNNAFLTFQGNAGVAFCRFTSEISMNFGNTDEQNFRFTNGGGTYFFNEFQDTHNDFFTRVNFGGGGDWFIQEFPKIVYLTRDTTGSGVPVALTWQTEAYGINYNVFEIVDDINGYFGFGSGAFINFKDALRFCNGGLSDGQGVTEKGVLSSDLKWNVPQNQIQGIGYLAVGGRRAQNTTSTSNTGAVEQVLHSLTVQQSGFNVDGDTAYAEFTCTTASNVNAKRLRVLFDGTQIYDSGTHNWNNVTLYFVVRGMRMSSTTVRWTVLCHANASPSPLASPVTTLTTSANLTASRVLDIRGTGAVANDLTAVYSFLDMLPCRTVQVIL